MIRGWWGVSGPGSVYGSVPPPRPVLPAPGLQAMKSLSRASTIELRATEPLVVSANGAAVPSAVHYVVTVYVGGLPTGTDAPDAPGSMEATLRESFRVFRADDLSEGFRVVKIKAFDAVILHVDDSADGWDEALTFLSALRDGEGFVPSRDKPDASHFPSAVFKGEYRPPVLALLPGSVSPVALDQLFDAGLDDYVMRPSVPRAIHRRLRSFARNIIVEEDTSEPLAASKRGAQLARSIIQYSKEHEIGETSVSDASPHTNVASLVADAAPGKRRPSIVKQAANDSALDKIQLRFKLGLMETEKRKVGELKAKNQELESQLEDLSSKLEAYESPMKSLLRTVADMTTAAEAGEALDPATVKSSLMQVIKDLTSSDLYEPIIDADDSDGTIDSSKAWVLEEFSSARAAAGHHTKSSLWKKHNAKVRAPFAFPNYSSDSHSSVAADSDAAGLDLSASSIEVTSEALKSLELPIFDLDEMTLVKYIVVMFSSLGLLEQFSIETQVLANFIRAAAKCYRSTNPYHNFVHAFDVCQTVFWLITQTSVTSLLSSLDVLCLMVAAVAHDLSHPGKSNNYLVATRDPLAHVYNDRSVLENHHASTLFDILANDECNVLAGLGADEWRTARDNIIDMILHTDMAKHFEMVGKFSVAASSRTFNRESDADRRIVCAVLLHAADISNPAKPLATFKLWVDRVSSEFFQQGDAERARDLPISPMMDRTKADIPSMEVNFINFVVLVDNMDVNKAYYETMRDKEQAAADAAAAAGDDSTGSSSN
ncbi:3',5'-cyclic-nucleotide phosphodiesterase regA [Thecamonas trahens ATCC 50062]|uniref:Phosphodiesterase n=1 Tax=Thecamonas trahens ATCC 50062 TaxID=461836 RepID=A0A0L0DL35_THETB|nr:3',5'-cyclic-nucleotide phosphodiesterase regA [Thecamonas trahens ATCC 50062]KNC52078.1 3',5'-cyclic-nucleotide phosphodiesterase regA [Thecamonas trahens ATCC 50062]|eukprot:XP_013762083.1 3',5'-cyclic-nucleotide phosphodiesterase regA [Thecamonas trahens ATCC 50062]